MAHKYQYAPAIGVVLLSKSGLSEKESDVACRVCTPRIHDPASQSQFRRS
jgi:hypothetical protein